MLSSSSIRQAVRVVFLNGSSISTRQTVGVVFLNSSSISMRQTVGVGFLNSGGNREACHPLQRVITPAPHLVYRELLCVLADIGNK